LQPSSKDGYVYGLQRWPQSRLVMFTVLDPPVVWQCQLSARCRKQHNKHGYTSQFPGPASFLIILNGRKTVSCSWYRCNDGKRDGYMDNDEHHVKNVSCRHSRSARHAPRRHVLALVSLSHDKIPLLSYGLHPEAVAHITCSLSTILVLHFSLSFVS
jgi:hypothetical protein